jgi:hypothetical protein
MDDEAAGGVATVAPGEPGPHPAADVPHVADDHRREAHWQPRHGHPLPFQVLDRIEYGIMLGRHGDDVAAAIPEPQTFALMLMGLGAVLLARHRWPRLGFDASCASDPFSRAEPGLNQS